MKSFRRYIKEDGGGAGGAGGGAPANSVGGGGVAGIGFPEKSLKGEPGVKKKKKIDEGAEEMIAKRVKELKAQGKGDTKECKDLALQLEAYDEPDRFAGAKVFEVDMDRWMKSRNGKNRYHRYSKYVGEDEKGEEIRQHGRTTKDDIILKDQATQVMTYLRRRKPAG